MIKQAIIPLAGLGTRLLPLTSVLPKELLPINGKPGLEYILDECIKSGIKEIILIISKKKQIIKRYFYNDLFYKKLIKKKKKNKRLKLEYKKIQLNNIIVVDANESKAILDYNIFLDDSPIQVKQIADLEKIALVYNQPWNLHIEENNNIIRVKNLFDVISFVRNFVK